MEARKIDEKPLDEYEPYREIVRRGGFKLNPYRLGRAVGELGADLPSPYTLPRSAMQYREGVRRGMQYRAANQRTKRPQP